MRQIVCASGNRYRIKAR
uniref:Uncharacterized protein n=1 Tax=Anguilla anguilla TaxID=7936 RepID=A0A0E9VJH4_ANGAN